MSLSARLAALERAVVPTEGAPIALWLDWTAGGLLLDGQAFARAEDESMAALAGRAIAAVQGAHAGRPVLVFSWQAP
jgi:hypothetical protein